MAEQDELSQGGYTSRPVPDPTRLTTEQLLRELGLLDKLINARIDGMDRAFQLQIDAAKEAVLAQAGATDRAVSKAEAAMVKNIENQQTILRTGFESVDTQISDLKGRLIRVEEGRSVGQQGFSNTVAVLMMAIGSVGLLIGIGSLIVALVTKDPPPVPEKLVIERQLPAPSAPRD
jgi:hypothetical protein